MTLFLFAAGYLIVALTCAYLEARLSADASIGPVWIFWPLLLPIVALMGAFEIVIWLGERHAR